MTTPFSWTEAVTSRNHHNNNHCDSSNDEEPHDHAWRRDEIQRPNLAKMSWPPGLDARLMDLKLEQKLQQQQQDVSHSTKEPYQQLEQVRQEKSIGIGIY